MLFYLNGELVPEERATVPVLDRGFLYGDGVYETMRSYGGVVFGLDDHVARLGRSASLIDLEINAGPSGLRGAVYETLDANSLKDAYVRVTVTRGSGPPGLDFPPSASPTLVVIAAPFSPYPDAYLARGLRVVIARRRRTPIDALDPKIKSLNFLNNILARREAAQAGAEEALMLNHEGALAECTASNIFFRKGARLCTPSAECGILDGITRAVIIGLAREEGVEVEEGRFLPVDLLSADEAFLTNTTMEAMPVGCVDSRVYRVGELTMRLRDGYARAVAEAVAAGRQI